LTNFSHPTSGACCALGLALISFFPTGLATKCSLRVHQTHFQWLDSQENLKETVLVFISWPNI
jgi:hypothetical protein